MKFKKYNSIENAYRKKTVNYLIENGLTVGKWIVQEKVHGSNLGFWTDGKEIKVSKRSSFLSEESLKGFFNSDVALEKNKDKILKCFNLLKNKLNIDIESIAIYGEIFGGSYPDVEFTDEIRPKMVQKGVYYTPNIEFYAFDIKVQYFENDVLESFFVNMDMFEEVVKECDFIYAERLFEGTFDEVMEYTNVYNSKIPKMISEKTGIELPELDENICEGNVLKPVEYKTMSNGTRVLLKHKNDAWTEKSQSPNKKNKKDIKLSEQANKCVNEFSLYVNDNRLKNVISKYGTVGGKEFGRLLGEFVVDALDDFKKDNENLYKSLNKEEQNLVNKEFNKICATHIRLNFTNIIDGTF